MNVKENPVLVVATVKGGGAETDEAAAPAPAPAAAKAPAKKDDKK